MQRFAGCLVSLKSRRGHLRQKRKSHLRSQGPRYRTVKLQSQRSILCSNIYHQAPLGRSPNAFSSAKYGTLTDQIRSQSTIRSNFIKMNTIVILLYVESPQSKVDITTRKVITIHQDREWPMMLSSKATISAVERFGKDGSGRIVESSN